MPVDLAPVDPNVAVPPSVQREIDRVAALHAQAYPADPVVTQPDAPVVVPPVQPDAPVVVPPVQVQPPVEQKPKAPAAPVPDSGEHGSWEHRFLSMQGRFNQSQQTIGGLQEQLTELGDELIRVQQALITARSGQPQQSQAPQQRAQPVRKAVTDTDVQTYGADLIDFVTRAARDAVAPDLQNVTQQVRQTSQRVAQNTQAAMFTTLDEDVPEWRAINVDPRFKTWCHSRDIYSNAIRGKLLNEAFQAADAPRVVAFFKGFLTEEQATGQMPAAQPEPKLQAPPRQAAIPLENLAAPGRAKPAGGDSPANAADKPVFTRAQISEFYVNVRKGAYNGRDADKARDEAAIFAAQREGRVR